MVGFRKRIEKLQKNLQVEYFCFILSMLELESKLVQALKYPFLYDRVNEWRKMQRKMADFSF